MVDALVLGTSGAIRGGSSPLLGTLYSTALVAGINNQLLVYLSVFTCENSYIEFTRFGIGKCFTAWRFKSSPRHKTQKIPESIRVFFAFWTKQT